MIQELLNSMSVDEKDQDIQDLVRLLVLVFWGLDDARDDPRWIAKTSMKLRKYGW